MAVEIRVKVRVFDRRLAKQLTIEWNDGFKVLSTSTRLGYVNGDVLEHPSIRWLVLCQLLNGYLCWVPIETEGIYNIKKVEGELLRPMAGWEPIKQILLV